MRRRRKMKKNAKRVRKEIDGREGGREIYNCRCNVCGALYEH